MSSIWTLRMVDAWLIIPKHTLIFDYWIHNSIYIFILFSTPSLCPSKYMTPFWISFIDFVITLFLYVQQVALSEMNSAPGGCLIIVICCPPLTTIIDRKIHIKIAILLFFKSTGQHWTNSLLWHDPVLFNCLFAY